MLNQMSILKRGNLLLNQKCHLVKDLKAAHDLIAALSKSLTYIQGLYAFKRGSGISAPQLGYLSRISIVEFEGVRRILVNPEIIDCSDEKIAIREGCLSFFDVRGNVLRYKSVVVKALDEQGSPFTLEAFDDFSMLLQHEIDHLDGILYVDRLPNKDMDLYPVAGMPYIP